MEQFSGNIDEYETRLKKMEECIWQFDKAMSLKSGKTSLHILKEEFENKYIDNEIFI